MADPDLQKALYHAQKSLSSAAYAFLALGVLFFFLGDKKNPTIIILPPVGVLATLLLGRTNQARWKIGRQTRGLVFSLPGTLAFIPFALTSGVEQGTYWPQLGFGVLWLILYVRGAKLVNDSWADNIAAGER